ncbi:oligosaccharide flippase family protein [Nioella aestuarii]|uniref:oligosaccharide flippase family protein n=1 Tax=Nioella aestuarii TaxID=1662864 RepID=UPI003D7F2A73
MRGAFRHVTSGDGLMARAMRSAGLNLFGFGFSQILRLASNLILTRLLFPEAFGVMAMVSVFLMGLAMFSDVGVGPAIMQSKRGDDRDFLNTAWTIQIIRGVSLWLVACALTWPMAVYFGEPDLVYYLPVAALTQLVLGFTPTRYETANRHLRAGRVTLLDMGTQVVGLLVAILLAWLTQSVWALVISGVLSAIAQVVLFDLFLPGERNRFRWESAAARELIHFGKWVFLSTIAGFAIGQADKVVIGGWLSTHDFGIYNIGFFWASFPFMMGSVVVRKVMIPIYRESPPGESRENFLRLRRMRMLATAGMIGMVMVPAFLGHWLIDLLYDPRYLAAGGMVVLISVVQIPAIVGVTYDQAALAAGDSKRFFVLAATRAVFVVVGMVVGITLYGLPGALAGQGLAMLAAHPVVGWLASRSRAWDPLHDAIYFGVGGGLGALALWWNWPLIEALAAIQAG